MTLDKSYTSKAEVANDVKEQLASIMAEFGYEIIAALVTDLEPDAKVKEAMNEINAAQRMREAALEKAEADKILVVKAAVSPPPSCIDFVRAHFVLCYVKSMQYLAEVCFHILLRRKLMPSQNTLMVPVCRARGKRSWMACVTASTIFPMTFPELRQVM
jgi:hypothetical protein